MIYYTSDDVDRIVETHLTEADRRLFLAGGIALFVGIVIGAAGASFLWGMI